MRRTLALAAALAMAACGRRSDPPAPASRAPKPAAAATPAPAAERAPCEVTVAAVPDGLWIATASGARRFIARCGHALDTRAASRELQSFLLALRGDCNPEVEVGGAHGADYEDILTAMDAARLAGFTRIGMTGASEVAAAFPAAPASTDRAPADCAPEGTEPPAQPPTTLSGDRVARGLVVSVEAETISVNGKPVCATSSDTFGLIPEIAKALPPPAPDTFVVVVGDRHLDATIVARVVRTLSTTGYKDIRFARAPR